jgi:NAD(P)-dependent dehydrogenase (short-subunit alcohol dehydrogenase family)
MKVIITGASKGIGKFLFDKFQSSGLPTIGTYLNTPPESIHIKNFFKVDLRRPDSVQKFVESLDLKDSKIILIHCAGSNTNGFAHKIDINIWSEIIDINLKGAFYISHYLLPHMREQKYGRIIYFSSIVPQMGIPGTSAYAASKAGLWGLTKSIAKENASQGITVNCLNLGYFNIGMISEVPEKMQTEIKAKIPIGDFGDPKNIQAMINFLIESDYTTGSSFDCNGGLF